MSSSSGIIDSTRESRSSENESIEHEDPQSPSPPTPPQVRRGRGRGRGRGRRRGGRRGLSPSLRGTLHSPVAGRAGRRPRIRGRGRGRGRRAQIRDSDRQRIADLQEKRLEGLRKTVQEMDLTHMRDLVVQILLRSPGLLFDILENHVGDPSPSPDPSSEKPSWCSCNNCTEMNTDLERLCCKLQPANCLSERVEMDIFILDPQVIAIANQHRADVFAAPNEATNRAMRHGAYRQFVLWRHGRLGQGVRRVIPSCCVKRVRHVYPEPNGVYTGFIPSRLT